MDHSRDIGSEHDIEQYRDVDISSWVCCKSEHMAHILQVDDMIYRMYGNHMEGVYRISDRKILDLENIERF